MTICDMCGKRDTEEYPTAQYWIEVMNIKSEKQNSSRAFDLHNECYNKFSPTEMVDLYFKVESDNAKDKDS
jgi:hypothetical protein